ncbi:hypothetical protein [[Limnothrix rosea] IAM M-220]|uniref:hypothetical protein n=1 Tax=[Limnothrix rosea] IAM M-220 TaxID=454133 RepID=UPI0015C5342B|nr:hypothetical protein [[Limnothrix rosea] IAM M-220]
MAIAPHEIECDSLVPVKPIAHFIGMSPLIKLFSGRSPAFWATQRFFIGKP